jgi:hypothetical protein
LAAYPELSEDEWTELIERLTQHASCRIFRHSWRGLRITQGGSVPGGVDPADLASAAITDVIGRERVWNPETAPNFLDYLRSVVDSKVSHLVNGLENRTTRRMTRAAAAGAEFDAPGHEPEPVTVLIDRETLERRRSEIVEAIRGKLVEGIFECVESNMTKPADIAVLLEVPVKEIYIAQKRLKRKVEALLKNTPKR